MKRFLPLLFVVGLFACSARSSHMTEAVINEWESAAFTAPTPTSTLPLPAVQTARAPYQGPPKSGRPVWRRQQPFLQGHIGVGVLDELTRSGGSTEDVEADFDTYPMIGGGGQWKLAGESVDWGLEAMLSMGGRADAAAFATGGGGTVIAVRIDMFIVDVYGGPFASAFLGDKIRVYGGLGPLVQWASYGQSGDLSGSGTGFGVGYYTRAGFEFLISPKVLLGLGARWADSRVDLGGGLGHVDVEGVQVFLTVTKGF